MQPTAAAERGMRKAKPSIVRVMEPPLAMTDGFSGWMPEAARCRTQRTVVSISARHPRGTRTQAVTCRRMAAKKALPTAAIIKELREYGLTYPGAHTKTPWPGHLDLAVKDKTFAYLPPEGEPFSISCKLPQSN